MTARRLAYFVCVEYQEDHTPGRRARPPLEIVGYFDIEAEAVGQAELYNKTDQAALSPEPGARYFVIESQLLCRLERKA